MLRVRRVLRVLRVLQVLRVRRVSLDTAHEFEIRGALCFDRSRRAEKLKEQRTLGRFRNDRCQYLIWPRGFGGTSRLYSARIRVTIFRDGQWKCARLLVR